MTYLGNDPNLIDGRLPSKTISPPTYAVALSDENTLLLGNAASGILTVNLPPIASLPSGFVLYIKKIDVSSNNIIVSANGIETIDGSGTQSISTTNDTFGFVKTGSVWSVFTRIVGGGGVPGAFTYNFIAGVTYIVTGSDAGKVLVFSNSSPITVTLPQQSTEALSLGFNVIIRQGGAGQVSVVTQGTDSLVSTESATKTVTTGSEAQIDLQGAGAPNTWFMAGDIRT